MVSDTVEEQAAERQAPQQAPPQQALPQQAPPRQASGGGPARSSLGREEAEGFFAIDYVPVFDCREERVNTCYIRPRLTRLGGEVLADEALLGHVPAGGKGAEAFQSKMMMLTLDAAFARAAILVASGEQDKVVVPVNGEALRRKHLASAFTARCRENGEAIRRTVLFEVTNLTGDSQMSWLDDVAIVLYPFCLSYGARILPKTQNLKLYATNNYSGISLDLLDKPWPLKAVGSYFTDLVARTEAARLKAYCYGLGTAELAEAARAAGVRFIAGKGVAA